MNYPNENHHENPHRSDEATLFRAGVLATPDNVRALNNFGNLLLSTQPKQAQRLLVHALHLWPNYSAARKNLALAYENQALPLHALQQLEMLAETKLSAEIASLIVGQYIALAKTVHGDTSSAALTERARVYADGALATGYRLPSLLHNRALIAYHQQQYVTAVR